MKIGVIMDLHLTQTPQNVTIIEGFPGFGLVGTIATEFLVNHLEMEEIGYVVLKNQQPLVAIHKDKLLKPISIYYNEKYNLIVVHAITPGKDAEWDIAEALRAIQAQTKAKKIISLEGVMSKEATSNVLYYSADDKLGRDAEKHGLKKLDDGLVVGVTAALMSMKTPSLVALFGEVHSQLPDSGAAAKMVQVLDKLLGLDVDPKPLEKQAELFEAKLKNLIDKSKQLTENQDKQVRYIG